MGENILLLNFSKMHGLGNDYIYINCFSQKVNNQSELAVLLSNRNFGIGSDGLVLIEPSSIADCKMVMFNSDGSQGEMCGNAVRCVGKYLFDNNIAKKDIITVETLSGIKTLKMTIQNGKAIFARVDMGEPIFDSALIPINTSKKEFVDEEIVINDRKYIATCVSMGNPHCVVFAHNIDNIKLNEIGPLFENYMLFPERVNTEFVEVINESTLKMRVWERGSGETLACGTGACAVAVCAILNNVFKRNSDITVKLKGGDLLINWADNGKVYMTGPATHVFDGTIDIN